MTINLSDIRSLLRPGLNMVFEDYNIYPDLWTKVYTSHKSEKAVEYDLEMQGLGLAQRKADGGPVAQGTMRQGYTTQYVHEYWGNSFQITRAALKDNLYQSQFFDQGRQLRNSLSTLKNINAMQIFNNAFNPRSTVSDGQPLCSVAHPISTGVLSNTFSNGVGLTESAVEDAITIIKSWLNLAGLQINYSAVKVLVPQKQAFNASRIFNSEYQPNSANNAINPIVHDKYMPGGYIVNQFVINPNSWYILTDCNMFKYFLRESVEFDFNVDTSTSNLTVAAIERYSFNCSNWRSVFGSSGM